jgi:putative exosortase-associated protein (TIGR04073 family)
MRKLGAVSVLGLAMVMGMAPAARAYDDNEMPPGIEKFTRGVVNIAVGAPEEVITHAIGAATSEEGEESLGAFVGDAIGGAFVGLFWGVARIGSGIVDVFTFPIPFNDNAPLVEPDHHI